MIAPLIPFGIRGAVWYQGESNADTEESSALYAIQLPLMVNDWRARWGQGDFPFGWVQLRFTHADGGLIARGESLEGFEIAGAEKQWRPATAQIEGERVLVSSDDVASPIAVRYAWANQPDGNLYNAAGLPASPFRTDHWPEE